MNTHKKNKTITSPKGFLAAGVHCGIKKSGNNDLGLLVCPTGAKAAAVFTTNKIVSAAVTVCKQHVNPQDALRRSTSISAVVVNSGNANACTGEKGIKNAIAMCRKTAQELKIGNGTPRGVSHCGRQSTIENVLVASTGIIGEQLPMQKIIDGIEKAVAQLSDSSKAGLDFVNAIMTTDTRPKQAVRVLDISGCKVTIAGVVKGAGMIAPNMATTLCFITTDAAISKPLLGSALKAAIGESLNRLTVDVHQSTNDTAIILASGLAGNRPIFSRDPRYKKFAKALGELCDDLARQMALDAEGATRMFKVVVKGAATKADAAKACRAIADYPLVKCAVHGGDPNWGRIICAAGSVGVKLNPEKLSCKLGTITVFKNGRPAKFDRARVSKVISQTEHTITVDLGAGKASDFCYGCDLSAGYVSINADYHT
jgi:glutamate N-acetyltransferase/amino-acid N-acetyltransferase